jgi:hypothetical protein
MAFLWMGLQRKAHDDGSVLGRLQERLKLRGLLQELVHQQPLVDDVDGLAEVPEPPLLIRQVPGVTDQRGVAPSLEELPEEVVFGAGGDFLVVHNGDHGLLGLAAGFAVAGKQGLEQPLSGSETPERITLLELLDQRQIRKMSAEHLRIGDPGVSALSSTNW